MHVSAAVASVSWIPSEAVTGLTKAGFTTGVVHYDEPPPDHLGDLAELHKADRFRFANKLAAWVDVAAGQVVDAGYSGRGYVSCTRVSFGARGGVTFQPAEFPELRTEPELRGTEAVFTQTVGGRTGLPYPRPVRGKPFLQWVAPTVWTTLQLTVKADGTCAGELISASPFPRHWVYGDDGQLAAKSGLAAYQEWSRSTFGKHTPWGDEDSQPLVTVAESALERQISAGIMRGGARPAIRRLRAGAVLAEQGQPGREIYLLLDGVVAVSVDGVALAELGPGAVLGERAVLENGRRTATLRLVTDGVVAVTALGNMDRAKLRELQYLHHREDTLAGPQRAACSGESTLTFEPSETSSTGDRHEGGIPAT